MKTYVEIVNQIEKLQRSHNEATDKELKDAITGGITTLQWVIAEETEKLAKTQSRLIDVILQDSNET